MNSLIIIENDGPVITKSNFWEIEWNPAGAPSVLIAYGELADQRLRDNKIIAGQYLQNLPNNFFLGSA